MKSSLIFCLVGLLLHFTSASAHYAVPGYVPARFDELRPLPEAKELLIDVAAVIDSDALRAAIAGDRTLQLMREAVRTSIFHLNLKFEVENENYPYDPPFDEPFPMRPTLEVMQETAHFLALVRATAGFDANRFAAVIDRLEQSPLYDRLQSKIASSPVPQIMPNGLSNKEILRNAASAYDQLQRRLATYGEVASFPEFEEAVINLILALRSDEVKALVAKNPTFEIIVTDAMAQLYSVRQDSGSATKLQAAFSSPLPYRRTVQAIENAVAVLDIKERLLYPEATNWHQVEASWQSGKDRKLLALYHFNRYKYQMFALLADHEVVLWPFWGEASVRDLLRLRAVPIGMLGVTPVTARADRHFNSPKDFLYHDINHFRRMWGYDKRKLARQGAHSRAAKLRVYTDQKKFVDDLLEQLKTVPNRVENQLRKMEIVLMFETEHETALTPDAVSFRRDIERVPETRQPFEVQIQARIADLETIRTFDGNLRSGADHLRLNLAEPTTVRYFWDRAPGFLANVDNKLRWGFYDSVFDMNHKFMPPEARVPVVVAEAAHRLLARLGAPATTPIPRLVKQIVDRSGQPELWAYFSVRDAGLISYSNLDIFNTIAARQIHDNWRRVTPRSERWLPADAKLADGARVIDEQTLAEYLVERKIPSFLHQFYRLDFEASRGSQVLTEDIRNLPYEYLSSVHQTENVMSGGKALSIIDRIWQGKVTFRTLDDVERWLISAVQLVHQAVLERNANGARLNEVYTQPWILLPKVNQRHDLDLLQIAFDSRLSLDPASLPEDQVLLFREGMFRLLLKIQDELPFRTCADSLSKLRDGRLDPSKPDQSPRVL